MKKLFVSVPMKGRTVEEIKQSISKMKQFAEIIEGEQLELIDSYIEENPPKTNNEAIWYLGKSIEKLSEADVFIGITDAWEWNGCQTEKDIVRRYGIKSYDVPPQYIMANYNEFMRSRCEEKMSDRPTCN